jgi:hypothetical protein
LRVRRAHRGFASGAHSGKIGCVSADETPSDPHPTWVVCRQDNNGNRFEVARLESRADAETLAARLEARGHRQIYRVAAADERP